MAAAARHLAGRRIEAVLTAEGLVWHGRQHAGAYQLAERGGFPLGSVLETGDGAAQGGQLTVDRACVGSGGTVGKRGGESGTGCLVIEQCEWHDRGRRPAPPCPPRRSLAHQWPGPGGQRNPVHPQGRRAEAGLREVPVDRGRVLDRRGHPVLAYR